MSGQSGRTGVEARWSRGRRTAGSSSERPFRGPEQHDRRVLRDVARVLDAPVGVVQLRHRPVLDAVEVARRRGGRRGPWWPRCSPAAAATRDEPRRCPRQTARRSHEPPPPTKTKNGAPKMRRQAGQGGRAEEQARPRCRAAQPRPAMARPAPRALARSASSAAVMARNRNVRRHHVRQEPGACPAWPRTTPPSRSRRRPCPGAPRPRRSVTASSIRQQRPTLTRAQHGRDQRRRSCPARRRPRTAAARRPAGAGTG